MADAAQDRETVVVSRYAYDTAMSELWHIAQDASVTSAVDSLFLVLAEAASRGVFEDLNDEKVLNPAMVALGKLLEGWAANTHEQVSRVRTLLEKNAVVSAEGEGR